MRVLLAPGGMYPEPGGVPLVAPGLGLPPQDVARHLAHGWARSRPEDELTLLPLPDGGPGTAGFLPASAVAERQVVQATGPLGQERTADLAMLAPAPYAPGSAGRTWYLDAAELVRLPDDPLGARREALDGSSAGLGNALAQALGRTGHEDTLVMGLSRSAMHDGGAGMVEALGGVRAAHDLLVGRSVLLALADVVALGGLSGAGQQLTTVTALGAQEAQALDRHACRTAAGLAAQAPQERSLLEPPEQAGTVLRGSAWGTGAAGGCALVLQALGARAAAGPRVLAELVGLAGCADHADLLLTAAGEAFDITADSTAEVVGSAAAQRAVPAVLVTGRSRVTRGELAAAGVAASYQLDDAAPGTRRWDEGGPESIGLRLEEMASRLARTWSR